MRFSLKSMLVAFAYIALSCMGLLYANRTWGACFFTGTLLLILLGIVAAFIRRGSAKAFWIGFAIFSGVYFWVAMFGEKLEPDAGGGVWHEPKLVTSTILLLLDDALMDGRLGSRKTTIIGAINDGSWRVTYSFGAAAPTLKVGHSIFTVVFGIVGGLLGTRLPMLNKRRQ